MKTLKRVGAAAMALSVGMTLAACGSDDSDGGSDGGDTITLGIIPSWTDGLSMAYLWQAVLEDEGYTVEIEEVAEAAPLYTGVARGDVDVYPSAWPEVTHASYMKEYGDDLEVIGTYYDNAKLTMAVPEYSELNSIEDLVGKADQYDGKIIGIEPGAGLTEITKNTVMPEYGLDKDYELVTSSTTAMLAELQKATDNEEDIVVTLWRPFWANTAFPVKDLEDPKGALGEPEGLAEVATAGFSDDHPDVAEMMANAKLDDEQYGSLEDMVVNEYGEGKEAEAVQAWLEENQDWVDSLQG
ncbi:glycine betaine ABC transporter substrate-binding protein [Nocardioides sambongensis]|uniref:glycine betaine ABC transporter substrate-binding protein n=1 Tax=Nocardioides sambongensis TaxID=2589074 RepID=UPI00112D7B3E|nr:glycine betaine ABC transporter substrate-binding protein [Nocardioides sambongensis]